MTVIPFGSNDWSSPLTSVNRIRLHNMYLVDNPLSPDGISRITRPTLAQYIRVGAGPIYGIWQQAGSFNGDIFVVSADKLYRLTGTTVTLIGSIPGTDNVQFAGGKTKIVVVRNGVAYNCDGATLSAISMPGAVLVDSVASMDDVFFLTVRNSNVFYWMNPGETAPGALNFASAERTPDFIESVNVIMDEIWFLGASGPEVWTSTGDLNAPYRRIAGRVYTEGCTERHTVVPLAYDGVPCLLWVTDKRTVVMTQGRPRRVSNDAIEEMLRGSSNYRAWGFRQNRHDFYVLTCDAGTYVYDLTKDNWCKWSSLGMARWRAHLGVQVGQTVYAADSDDNNIWTLEEGTSDEGTPLLQEISGFVIHPGNQIPCYAVNVRMNLGWTSSYDDEPQIELRWSDDLGVTWSDYVQLDIGKKGEYSQDVTFRSLGFMYRPGRDFELRFTEKERIRIDYATMNEV